MHVLIIGEGKSGTSALCYAIAAGMKDAQVYFEPPKHKDTDRLNYENTVTKIVLEQEIAGLNQLVSEVDKCVFVVRDPRDNLVSRALYAAYSSDVVFDEHKINAYIEKIRSKERSPASSSLLDIIRFFENTFEVPVIDQAVKSAEYAMTFWHGVKDYCYVYSYENMVSGNFVGLEEYLGFSVPRGVEVPDVYRRVVRTKSQSDWKRWFTAEDIDYFRPLMKPFMHCFGYKDDWKLKKPKSLDSAYGSEYVRGLFFERLKSKVFFDEEFYSITRICNICGCDEFRAGPGGRLSKRGSFPQCSNCESLERHRVVREVFKTFPIGFLGTKKALQLGTATGVKPEWFMEYSYEAGRSAADNLPTHFFTDGQFDFITLDLVLEYCLDDQKAFRDLVRVMSPRGVLHINFGDPDRNEKTVEFDVLPDNRLIKRQYGLDIARRLRTAELGLFLIAVREYDPGTSCRLVTHIFCKNPYDAVSIRAWLSLGSSSARILPQT